MVPNQPQPALLFMPDISGFTQFVNETEIFHSQQIIQELLEVLIECNQLGLQVGEIEGDAIFFYKLGNKPCMPDLLKQVEKMFTSFHQHLKLYEQQRICPCKACTSAGQLSLKIVAHYGEVTGIAVKEHKKLFGKDVILIHRLLKNNLDKKEYVLLTNPVVDEETAMELPPWYSPQIANEQYDLGMVQFYFSDLAHLLSELPPVSISKHKAAANASVAFSDEEIIPAFIDNVFAPIFDLPQRAKWVDGLKAIEMVTNDHIHRVGTKHRCIISEKNNPTIITESVQINPDHIELVEMDEKGLGGCRYSLDRISPSETKLKIQVLVKNNPVIKTIFSLTMKPKLVKRIRKTLENLKKLCTAYQVSEVSV